MWCIYKSTYAKALVKKFILDNCNEARMPKNTTTKIPKDVDGESIDIITYCSMFGSLIYAQTVDQI